MAAGFDPLPTTCSTGVARTGQNTEESLVAESERLAKMTGAKRPPVGSFPVGRNPMGPRAGI